MQQVQAYLPREREKERMREIQKEREREGLREGLREMSVGNYALYPTHYNVVVIRSVNVIVLVCV